MRNLLLLSAVLITVTASLYAASMTTLTVAVKTLNDSPVDGAGVIVKFVKGRAKLKLGKKSDVDRDGRTGVRRDPGSSGVRSGHRRAARGLEGDTEGLRAPYQRRIRR